MKTTFYGQSTFEIETGGKKLLFDPFITPNPAAKDIDIHSLKPDYILVSHGHGDHVADLIAIQKSSGAIVICIAEIANWLGKQGINNAHGMNIGGAYTFDFGRVKMVNAIHSSTMPDGSPGGNPAGFVIYAEDKAVYFAGDTALTYDMKLLADEDLDLVGPVAELEEVDLALAASQDDAAGHAHARAGRVAPRCGGRQRAADGR